MVEVEGEPAKLFRRFVFDAFELQLSDAGDGYQSERPCVEIDGEELSGLHVGGEFVTVAVEGADQSVRRRGVIEEHDESEHDPH
ncbi:hypothetical protein [Rathayibacter sp. VKM Ac-2927]|uniref:hypothetical protein n=1 Tax=Rathayibacter sp. VKM Ac-2927 TaxID=2929478 RepID=UPI001FB30D9A|nr:hypothetical protein [Rathayibacter sp. VKM Ac-2927]MCJ1688471.1 hypothetical protein [Rathayibacter sp. VKM Ac-2927]